MIMEVQHDSLFVSVLSTIKGYSPIPIRQIDYILVSFSYFWQDHFILKIRILEI